MFLVYALVSFIWSLVDSYHSEDLEKFFLFMTNHGKLILVVHGTLSLILCLFQYRHYSTKDKKQVNRVTRVHIVSVFVQNGMLVLLCQISFSYWAIIFPRTGNTGWLSIQGHAVNTLIAIIDVLISDLPFLMSTLFAHFAYGLIYVLVQICVNCFTSHSYIYKDVIAWCTSKYMKFLESFEFGTTGNGS